MSREKSYEERVDFYPALMEYYCKKCYHEKNIASQQNIIIELLKEMLSKEEAEEALNKNIEKHLLK